MIDWSLKASDGVHRDQFCKGLVLTVPPDIKLDNLEFSALPSGLHLVEQDVVCVYCLSPRFPSN